LDTDSVLRILVAHADGRVRQELIEACRRTSPRSASVHAATSAAEATEACRRIAPDVALIDLASDVDLALDAALSLRGDGRLLVGVYNPLVERHHEAELFRRAVRSGFSDFVALPVSDVDLAEVLARSSGGEAARQAAGRVVSFVSHAGGVGTTTLAVSAAMMLAGSEEVRGDVALCDASLPFGNAAAFLGMTADRDLADLVANLDDPGALSAYLVQDPRTGLKVLPCARNAQLAASVTPGSLTQALLRLRSRFTHVVVDTPPSLDLMTLAALDLSEAVFVVTEAVTPTVLATARFLEALAALGFGGDRVRIVVNRHRPGDNLAEGLLAERFRRGIDHFIAWEDGAAAAATEGKPLLLERKAARFAGAIGALADDIVRGS